MAEEQTQNGEMMFYTGTLHEPLRRKATQDDAFKLQAQNLKRSI